MKDIKEFLRFLQQNKAMGLFIHNLLNTGTTSTYHFLTSPDVRDRGKKGRVIAYLKWQTPFDFLQRSFDWSRSLQGDLYWRKLNAQWREQLYKFNNTTS